jgi:hypothetical protein
MGRRRYLADCAELNGDCPASPPKANPCRYSQQGQQDGRQTAGGPGGLPKTCPMIKADAAKALKTYLAVLFIPAY